MRVPPAIASLTRVPTCGHGAPSAGAILCTGTRAKWDESLPPFVEGAVAREVRGNVRWVLCVRDAVDAHLLCELPRIQAIIAVDVDGREEALLRVLAMRLQCGVLILRKRENEALRALAAMASGAPWPESKFGAGAGDAIIAPGTDSEAKIDALATAVGYKLEDPVLPRPRAHRPVRDAAKARAERSADERRWRATLRRNAVVNDDGKERRRSEFFMKMMSV